MIRGAVEVVEVRRAVVVVTLAGGAVKVLGDAMGRGLDPVDAQRLADRARGAAGVTAALAVDVTRTLTLADALAAVEV